MSADIPLDGLETHECPPGLKEQTRDAIPQNDDVAQGYIRLANLNDSWVKQGTAQ